MQVLDQQDMLPAVIARQDAPQSKKRSELAIGSVMGSDPGYLYPKPPELAHGGCGDTAWKQRSGAHSSWRSRGIVALTTPLHSTILYYTILYYTILYYTILYYTILYYTILYYTILYYSIVYYTLLYSSILYYTEFGTFAWVPSFRSAP